jgi:anaerobic ribonucleoside-triphosphate reductase activating protein
MRYNTIKLNDVANGPGIGVSVYLQGCPHRCNNCFNPETWDENGGQEFTVDTLTEIIEGLTVNGVKRHLSILGGEPLSPENQFLTRLIISSVKEHLPDTPIYIWTGYTLEYLLDHENHILKEIFDMTDVIVDGPYIDELRDITLKMRGSSNQIVWIKVDGIWQDIT